MKHETFDQEELLALAATWTAAASRRRWAS
jgi:hypothetical protein